jgi:hypothetical protein
VLKQLSIFALELLIICAVVAAIIFAPEILAALWG